MQIQRQLINIIGIKLLDNRLTVNITEQRNLVDSTLIQLNIAAADNNVRLNTQAAQSFYAVLYRLGFDLTGQIKIRHQRHMDEQRVMAAQITAHLTNCLNKGQRFNITHHAADLHDDHIKIMGSQIIGDGAFDLIGNVRNNLYGIAAEVAGAFPVQNTAVNATQSGAGITREADIHKTLIMAHGQVGFHTVVGHKNLAVLIRIHQPVIGIKISIQALYANL